jgi:hypothetical protein
MNNIVKMYFGSHLYGTNTESSDVDYKGIYLPSLRQVFLCDVPKSVNNNTKSGNSGKNTPDDVDEEIYSLHYFIKLALNNETIAIDMLHCSDELLVVDSPIWQGIRRNRSKFYTKKLNGYTGYIYRQSAKYGQKGSRLDTCEKFMDFLKRFPEDTKLSTIWEKIPIFSEHIKFIENSPNNLRQLMVVGKIIQETVTTDYAYYVIKNYHDEYGHRAKLAKENQGIEWKAVSHAYRYCLQIEELIETDDIIFPLKERQLLIDIKKGKYNYLEEIGPMIDEKMNKINKLFEVWDVPKEPDKEFWNEFIVKMYDGYYTNIQKTKRG